MIHPAFAIDLEAASARFHASLFGGDYWDELAVAMRPDLKQIGDEHLDYTFDACIDHDLAEEGVDPRSPERSEERRVGKARGRPRRSGWSPYPQKKNTSDEDNSKT